MTFSSMSTNIPKRPTPEELISGIIRSDRVALARGITLVESKLPSDRALAEQLIDRLLSKTGKATRIGVSGIPGVGKSTFIEAFGEYLVSVGKKVAVLAVDPSSKQTKGSILGDKTRMNKLAVNPNAYIRPTPTGSTLGGVADQTREAMLLCEAAGFDVILIETVGVGQSETLVRDMCDFFLLLTIAGAGDDLQGIKKGIMEMADAIVINKADGDNMPAVRKTLQELKQVTHYFSLPPSGWVTQVTTCSSLLGEGISELWTLIESFKEKMIANGYLAHQRSQQNLQWMHQKLDGLLKQEFNSLVKEEIKDLAAKVETRELNPVSAAHQLFDLYKKKKG
ncbi:membrane ATPase/protein kinase [Imperialibacter sp. EC-SDR9]|nr:membrane ATPase/protein kinase [Imperialibacter sp. EC-SDR9]